MQTIGIIGGMSPESTLLYSPLPTFDSTALHTQAAVRFVLNKSKL